MATKEGGEAWASQGTQTLSPLGAPAATNLRRRGAWVVSNNERSFVKEAVRQEQRTDGRGLFDFRNIRISFAREDGTAEVDLGGATRVLAAASAELTQPFADRENEGSLAIFVDVSAAAHEGGGGGSGAEEAVELARIVDRSLRDTRAVDLEALCVATGSLVWAVRVDVHVLDHGGNLVDATSLAVLAALMSFRCPEVTVSSEQEGEGDDGKARVVTIHNTEERDPKPLILHMLPVTCTFAFFNDGNDVVLDPNVSEECAMGGRFTVAMSSAEGDVCAMQKPGGVPVSVSQLLRCIRIAAARAPELEKKLRDAVSSQDASRVERKVRRWRRAQGDHMSNGETVPVHLKMEVEEEEEIKVEEEEEEEDEDKDGGGGDVGKGLGVEASDAKLIVDKGKKSGTNKQLGQGRMPKQEEDENALSRAGDGSRMIRMIDNNTDKQIKSITSDWLEEEEEEEDCNPKEKLVNGKGARGTKKPLSTQGGTAKGKQDNFQTVADLIERSSNVHRTDTEDKGTTAKPSEGSGTVEPQAVESLSLKDAIKRNTHGSHPNEASKKKKPFQQR